MKIKNQKPSHFPYAVAAICLIIGVLYFLELSGSPIVLRYKIYFLYDLLFLASLWWLLWLVYKLFFKRDSLLYQKFNILESLLLDIRDGTKAFFIERRKFPRLKDSMTARIAGQDELIKVIDISYVGAHLKTSKQLQPNDVLDLSVFLPIFPQPIVVKAKVIWASVVRTEGQPESYKVGIEYLEMGNSDREKLFETLKLLGAPRHK
jgi:hypothetical protein